MRVSFADYICVRNGAEMIKEAVPGTTLADNGSSSYIARLKRIKPNMKVDLLVCQLSTNDAWTSSSLGELSGRKEPDEYDTSSLAGAIEFIIVYTQKTWGCPVVFYTSPRFISERYGQMVNLLNRACDLWQISLIDMWNDEKFCALSEDQQKLYKADDIHPTQAGYLEWWTPYMEPVLCNVLEKKQEY